MKFCYHLFDTCIKIKNYRRDREEYVLNLYLNCSKVTAQFNKVQEDLRRWLVCSETNRPDGIHVASG